jgi:hypothetical protein
VFERRFDHTALEIPGWMVMQARRKSDRLAASVCDFVARRRRCPGLMVVETYVAIGAIPPVTEVAQVMCLKDGVVVGATGGAACIGLCDGAIVGNGTTLRSGAAIGAAAGSRAAGATLVLVRPQRAGNRATGGAAIVGSTGGGGLMNGAGGGCTFGSAEGMGGGSSEGMMSGRPVCWEKMSDS